MKNRANFAFLLGISLVFNTFLVGSFGAEANAADSIRVGSKAFTEGFLLGELGAQTIERAHAGEVTRKFGLGNTGILYEALKKGEIDVYSEYTGTISEALLKDPKVKEIADIKARVDALGLVMSDSLGFNNTYALAVTKSFAKQNGLSTLSDLKKVEAKVRPVFSHEFVSRADGLSSLSKTYGLNFGKNRQSLEHSLAYEAVLNGSADLIDVYSTDPKIKRLELVVLEDNLHHFPRYEAVWLARKDFVERHPEAWLALRKLEGTLSEDRVIELNAHVEIDKLQVPKVIRTFVEKDDENRIEASDESGFIEVVSRIWLRTKEHLVLVGITLLLSIAVGVPLGILAVRHQRLGQALLLGSSIVQTIPSLALLCFLIPVFGIGLLPALVALFLYSLLPVLLNTYIGLKSIDSTLIETAHALGLSPYRRLVSIELPIASPSILAGIKTATIISIGTATLAALIGAGGYGAPIVSGLAMNDMNTILMGAIPAAVMSLFAHFLFEVLNRILVPAGLQL